MSVLALWGLLYGLVLSGFQESRSQKALYGDFRLALASETAPVGGLVRPGTPVALMTASRAGVRDLVIVEGTSAGELMKGPGHLRSSVLPGQAGVSVVFGRSVTFGAPFARVPSLRAGDLITVTTQQGVFSYAVDRVRHVGDPLPAAPTAGTSRLLLVTSEGRGWRSGWAPSRPVYVDATLRAPALPPVTPVLVASAVPSAEGQMRGDPGSLVLLVLGLQGLLIASVGTVVAAARWTSVQAFAAGAPVILAALWFVTIHAAQLLPNLI